MNKQAPTFIRCILYGFDILSEFLHPAFAFVCFAFLSASKLEIKCKGEGCTHQDRGHIPYNYFVNFTYDTRQRFLILANARLQINQSSRDISRILTTGAEVRTHLSKSCHPAVFARSKTPPAAPCPPLRNRRRDRIVEFTSFSSSENVLEEKDSSAFLTLLTSDSGSEVYPAEGVGLLLRRLGEGI
jgi:hypothetical protein